MRACSTGSRPRSCAARAPRGSAGSSTAATREGGGATPPAAVAAAGGSSADFASYTPLDTGRDLAELARGLALDDLVLVGNSMAAASAAWAAAELRKAAGAVRVRGVVMLCPFAWDHPMPFGVATALGVLLADCWGAAMWRDYVRGLYKQPPADVAAHLAALRANLAQPGRMRALRGQVFGLKLPCAERMPELAAARVPVLAVWGAKDPDFADIEVERREMLRRLPQAATAVAPGAGHYVQAEAPRLVADEIAKWLAAAGVEAGAV